MVSWDTIKVADFQPLASVNLSTSIDRYAGITYIKVRYQKMDFEQITTYFGSIVKLFIKFIV